jgi:hypothetical protein
MQAKVTNNNRMLPMRLPTHRAGKDLSGRSISAGQIINKNRLGNPVNPTNRSMDLNNEMLFFK